ncbi:dienelactone hydrolase [Paenibacillus phyllosphaerae]|uniref:Dienelactone hydrolase n=1 Tax=Paenibacillus phyllosphaerae TaxID=274593 RepID=A0A7W5AUE5_9BACL|nr:CocE/NonD family hydrolase [Paenibacillus phyllosphaerae]MBB3108863.1 dienelactone hydrolase [Paenibacillus phyllosphaerae]
MNTRMELLRLLGIEEELRLAGSPIVGAAGVDSGEGLRVPPRLELLRSEERAGYRLETLLMDVGDELAPVDLALPLEGDGPYPLVIVNHSHGGNYDRGRRELTDSSSYLQQPSFAEALTSMGYAACCMDMRLFNDRSGKTESELFKELLWHGKVLWGQMVKDTIRLVDAMAAREDIDAARIGTLGMSMGGLMSWWLAALDERIQVTVDICGQVEAATLIAMRGLDHHGLYSYVPGLLRSFRTLDIQRLIAPRPRISLNGRSDRLCPIEGVQLLDEGLSEAYASLDAAASWQSVLTGAGHRETAEMRAAWERFLSRRL